MKCPFKVKVCTKCKRILIACSDNFAKDKKGKYGFCGQCKICIKKYKKEWNKKK